MMIKGLPLEFKLLRKGEFVGYGKFAINIDHPAFGLTWHTSTNGKVWYYGNCVLYDEMRQYTDFKAKNGKIYFGDKLTAGKGLYIYTVRVNGFGRIVAMYEAIQFNVLNFKDMELTDG